MGLRSGLNVKAEIRFNVVKIWILCSVDVWVMEDLST